MAPGRRAAVLLLALATAVTSGCWSGFAWQAARRHELVTRYDAAWSDGQDLIVRYDVVLTDDDGSILGHEPRAARLALADLSAESVLPVDAVPVRALPVPPPLGPADRPVPILHGEGESDGALQRGDVAPGLLVLRARERDGSASGLEILGAAVPGAPPAPQPGWLDSDVLYREGVAFWIVPALPAAAVFDVAILPLQLLTAWPFFVFGD